MKKLIGSAFVLEGWVDLQSFRMRSLSFRVESWSNKNVCLTTVYNTVFQLLKVAL